jgi:hypothetical protein
MKQKLQTLAAFLFCVCFAISQAPAQNIKPCGTDEALKKLYAQYPELIKEHELFLENNKRIIQQKDGRITTTYVIPIVFHILHQNGTENITDAQVYDAMAILNRDFSATNPDTNIVINVFKPLIGDAGLEFRLASKDKSGFCTNGIEHIYSHETNNSDDFSKINQWPRTRYLNVWVVKSIGTTGTVAGYSYYPSATSGFGYFRDGVIILHDYVGSIGTGTPGRSRALTHEIGHYLGLAHPWGSTNEPNIACGDDGINDTPETMGSNLNCNLNLSVCNPPIIENVQNYMDYSYCSRMFTIDQCNFMGATMLSSLAFRNNLWQQENLDTTGTTVLPAPLCSPLPDFRANRNYVCQGGTVTFTNMSQRATIASYQWDFPGGTPATSTVANPVVTFNTPGWQSVTLTVSNASGTETKTANNFVFVSPGWTDFLGPYSESFEGSSANLWTTENPENNPAKWEVIYGAGSSGNKSFRLANNITTNDPFYFGRLGGNKDILISPSYNLSSTTNAILTFKYSCATSAGTTAELTEMLRVYSSSDCGATWTLRKSITGTQLANAGFWGTSFIPGSPSLWTTTTVNLSSLQIPNIRFKFEYTSSDFSNNIYLDDINVEGVLSTGEITSDYFVLSVYPNPVSSGTITLRYFNHGDNVDISLTDMTGRRVYYVREKAVYGERELTVDVSSLSLAPGIYSVSINDGRKIQSSRVAVY